MRVALICADDDVWASGVRSISATLRDAGHDTVMVFAGTIDQPIDDGVAAQLSALAQGSHAIGVSSMSRGADRAKRIIEVLRPLGVPIAWGGMHPTLNPEDCTGHADLVCMGEGEGFMLDLLGRIEEGRDWSDIPNGVCASSDGEATANGLRPLIELDDLPIQEFALSAEHRLVTGANGGEFVPNADMNQATSALLSGSRGCLYQCTYCSNSQLKLIHKGLGRFARKMSVRRFVEHAKEYRRLFPHITYFYFTDEDFFARPIEEIREFAEIYSAEVGLPFECMASPRQITDEKMELMVKAGMWRIDIGLESGSEAVRRSLFDRPITDDVMMKAAAAVNRYPQVVAYYFLIIGNPYETRQDLEAGLAFLRQMPTPFFLRTYSLAFMPGTPLFDRAREDGIIKGVEDSASDDDFLAGLDYRRHGWKRRNLYLNALLYLMAGRSTKSWMGALPRFMVPALMSPKAVDFSERHPKVAEMTVNLGTFYTRARRWGVDVVSRITGNPNAAYSTGSEAAQSES